MIYAEAEIERRTQGKRSNLYTGLSPSEYPKRRGKSRNIGDEEELASKAVKTPAIVDTLYIFISKKYGRERSGLWPAFSQEA